MIEPAAAPAPRAAELERPLPPEVLARHSRGPLSYRGYPVFGWPWWWRRQLLFCSIAATIGGLVAAVLWASVGQPGSAALAFGYFVAGAAGMAGTGPAIATWVRHRHLDRRRELPLVVGALVLGFIAAALVDGWSSSGIERALASTRFAGAPAQEAGGSAVGGGIIAALVYGLLGGGLGLVRYLQEDRELAELAHRRELAALRERQRELDARLGLLQAQIEPHFLFNTLASVHSLITAEPPAAQRVLDELVTYLRATIPRLRQGGARLDSTLGQQLDLCASYLRVMQSRMGERLRHQIECPPELAALAFPPLLLLTLVENAIKHGLEPKRGPGAVLVRAERSAARLRVSVRDDGVGLRGELGAGVGLENLRQWLDARYGAKASLSLTSAPDGGAVAAVELPVEELDG